MVTEFIFNNAECKINLYETFNNNDYSIVIDNDTIILNLNNDYICDGVDLGKLQFTLTPYFSNVKLAI